MNKMTSTYTPQITIIEPTIKTQTLEKQKERRLKVAAYARVSTEQDEQQSSYEAQVSYYTDYITRHEGWELAGIYADEGISGTNTKKREGFLRMMADAEAGKIDLILTKSISRFARNTVDTLSAVRALREKNIEVVFEKENLRTLDPKGEVMLTIMSSLAQEESRSISENVRWGKKKSMMDGKISIAYKTFLGYRKGPDGKPEIVEEEAEIVRKIYDWYLSNNTIRTIARKLTEQGVPTPAGKTYWSVSTIRSILSNEKYKGDARLQKTYVSDYLTKKVKRNKGELQQVYLTNSHPAIIEPEKFDLVQRELARRSKDRQKLRNNSPFSNKVICECCGEYFGHKVFTKKDGTKTDAWYCNHRYDGDNKCDTPIIREPALKASFLRALREVLAQNPATGGQQGPASHRVHKTAEELETARKMAETALNRAVAELRALVADNANRSQDQSEFLKRHSELSEGVEMLKSALRGAEEEIMEASAHKERMERFSEATKGFLTDSRIEYSDELVEATLETIVVSSVKDGKYSLRFMFANGSVITENME